VTDTASNIKHGDGHKATILIKNASLKENDRVVEWFPPNLPEAYALRSNVTHGPRFAFLAWGRLIQIARRGQSLPKGGVVRHGKIGPPIANDPVGFLPT
jgi:hypothetical protein